MANLVLRITEPTSPMREVEVTDGLTFGRHPDNGYVLLDAKVSGVHARVSVTEDGAVYIEDCGSSNKTRIVGGPVLGQGDRFRLEGGTRMQLGLTKIEVVAPSNVAPTTLLPITNPKDHDDESISTSTSSEAPTPSVAMPVVEVESDAEPSGRRTLAEPVVSRFASSVPEIPPEPSQTPPEDTAAAHREADLIEDPTMVGRIDSDKTDSVVESDTVRKSTTSSTARLPIPNLHDDAESPEEATIVTSPPPPGMFADAPPVDDSADDEQTIVAGPALGPSSIARPDPRRGVTSSLRLTDFTEDETLDRAVSPGIPAHEATMAMSGAASGRQAQLSDLEALKEMRPRVVFADPKLRESVEIRNVNFSLGRQRNGPSDVDFAIDHPTVSTKHASIRFSQRHFFIEDCGSKNGTFVNGKALPIMASRELKPESHLRLGVVDSVFIVDRDTNLDPADKSLLQEALNLLVRRGLIKRRERDEALRARHTKNMHPGESLLLDGKITVEQWVDAMGQASTTLLMRPAGHGGWLKLIVWMILFAGLLVGALRLWRPELF